MRQYYGVLPHQSLFSTGPLGSPTTHLTVCSLSQLVDLVKAYCHGEFSEDVVKVRPWCCKYVGVVLMVGCGPLRQGDLRRQSASLLDTARG